MTDKKIQFYAPLRQMRVRARLSEREASVQARLARSTLRQVEAGSETASLASFASACEAVGSRAAVLAFSDDGECSSDCSTVAASLLVAQEGEDSWKTHFMDLVDAFRGALDPRLLLLPPSAKLPPRLVALLASTVLVLCDEAAMDPPDWATKSHWLPSPWFVAGLESLKASAIVESPLAFRRNNIFVLKNFLERA